MDSLRSSPPPDKGFRCLFAVFFTLALVLVGGLIYAACHFLAKVW